MDVDVSELNHFFYIYININVAITTCRTCTCCALPIQSNCWVPLNYTKRLSQVGSRPSERKVKSCFTGATPEWNPWERWKNIIKKKRPLAGTSNSCRNKQATEEFFGVELCTKNFYANHPSVIRSSPDGNNKKSIWRLQQPKWKQSFL